MKREYGQIIDTQGLVVISGGEGVWWRWLLEILVRGFLLFEGKII